MKADGRVEHRYIPEHVARPGPLEVNQPGMLLAIHENILLIEVTMGRTDIGGSHEWLKFGKRLERVRKRPVRCLQGSKEQFLFAFNRL